MKPKSILSIDWDYFFPNSMPYDMGHNENLSPTLQEVLWSIRTSSHNLVTGEPLLEAYVPTVPETFWSLVMGTPEVYVSDSHYKIWDVLQDDFLVQVTSLDAHHDCGYGPQKKPVVNCSNWGYWGRKIGLIGRLDLWYPIWRVTSEENHGGRTRGYKPTSVNFGLPYPAEYDRVFICRSGSWTPPWFDDDFLKFLPEQAIFLEDVSPRSITKERARELRDHTLSNIKVLERKSK